MKDLSPFSSARFEGSLNVDLNEITMNLVPFPRLHYLLASQTPLYALADIKIPPRRFDLFCFHQKEFSCVKRGLVFVDVTFIFPD